MKKIDIAKRFLNKNLSLFKCSVCGKSFVKQVDNSIICPNNHSLDISKKGTIHFINHKVNTEYDGDMLESRRNIITAGFFDGILEQVEKIIPSGHQTIVDVGSGEGSPLSRLEKSRNNIDSAIGFDISKPGVNLSTSENRENIFFCIADLAKLPFADHSISVVMDLFSPSSYKEFNRVISTGGHLIKIVPNSNYLVELRNLLYGDNQKNSSYDNNQVIDLFMKHYPSAKSYHVKYNFPLPAKLRKDLMIMTPLHWGKNAKSLSDDEINKLSSITVDVTVLDNKF